MSSGNQLSGVGGTGNWKIFGLTTADRPERERFLRAELARTGLEFEVLVSERPGDPDGFASAGYRGCFESHLKALHKARDQGIEVAVIAEDDAVIVRRFARMRSSLADEMNEVQWSVLYLGYLGSQSPARFQQLELTQAHIALSAGWEVIGAHLVAINHQVIDALIANFETRLLPGGHKISPDGVLNEFRRDTSAPTLLCVPNLSRQAPSPSGITPGSGTGAKLLEIGVVQKAALTFKRTWWDLESYIPARTTVQAWNLRARLLRRG